MNAGQQKQVGFVQFHPSYDYTDFVEGLRPDEKGCFVRTDGVFKDFCKRAVLESSQIFSSVYKKLVDLISEGTIVSYPLMKGGENKLSIVDNQIVYHTGNKPRTESIANIEMLYNSFVTKNKFDISDITSKDLDFKIEELTGGTTKNVDSTEYLWTLQTLLSISKYRKDSKYVFIVDEINRGELSKIFGELFYSIEPDYRGPSGIVRTQYNNMVPSEDIFKDGFYVPENVYIIGTMNDVDRGVEAMDFAIRRRFAWKEVTAEESANNMGLSEEVKRVMKALNTALTDNGLSQAHHIGGAYFHKLDGSNYNKLWANHLKGIIAEYFRGDPDADKKVEEIEGVYKRAYTAPVQDAETE